MAAEMPLNNSVNKRINNFDLLRLIAALMVFYSHAYAVFGWDEPALSSANILTRLTLGRVGVCIFFTISGFLVTSSYFNHNGNLKKFFLARMLRIYPGYIIQYLIVCIVICAAATPLKLADYFGRINVILQIANMILLQSPPSKSLSEVFSHNPISTINSSLWTLIIEMEMYFMIAYILKFQEWFGKHIILVVAPLLFGLSIYQLFYDIGSNFAPFCYGWCFCMGSIFYLYNTTPKVINTIAIAVIFFAALSERGFLLIILYGIAIPWLVIKLAFFSSKLLPQISSLGDYSYGIYLYAFPIEQFCYVVLPHNFCLYFISSLILTLGVAIFSWNCIEKPSLILKQKLMISS